MTKSNHCATCPETTKNTLADGWILLDQSGKYRDWIWECQACADKRIGPTNTIATFRIPANKLPWGF